ncbi:hypothetical protein L2E82_18016 [Cichorium intybus]|uniref:Uncharacterized protein n=1 Tax=Cichorium intybus TaxID=13427 RepID=A0ACB9F8U5_CICIN|nr:hypothetical protein L2E82_18016 [Cichorium intybus]
MPCLRAPINQAISHVFLVYLIPTIEMAFRHDHPFLHFPEILESTPEYMTRRDELISRRVLEATIFYRDILTQAGLWAEIEPFLHRTWSAGEFTFTCHDWERLMANQDDIVYTELLLEFLSTVHYAPSTREVRSRPISIRLGGVSKECSLRDFRRRTEIYTEEELQSRHFAPFLWACIQGQPDRAANATIWATISDVRFEAGSARESLLRNPLHRLMHRIISTSVMQKQGGEKVSGEDMTFM